VTSTERTDFRLFAVTGDPILHSRSPALFSHMLKARGIAGAYLRLSAADFGEALRVGQALGLDGLNVTAPFKDQAAALCEPGHEAVRRLGAANLLLRKGETWLGFNTDPDGVIGALEAVHFQVQGKRVVVLGAGGAGRAAAWALRDHGAEVVLVNRGVVRAREAAEEIGCAWAGLDAMQGELAKADGLVSCLPGDVLPLEAAWLHPGLTVLDANYARGKVGILAAAAGCKQASGLDWLLHQALSGMERLFGDAESSALLKDALTQKSSARPNVALCGLMGSGKTSVGRLLARKLGWDFVDVDALVEERSGRSVGDVFASDGEAAFRAQETEALRIACAAEGRVIACGGGAVLSPANRELLNKHCTSIWLWSSPEVCASRLAGEARPLLVGTDRRSRLEDLLKERLAHYAQCADLVLESESRSPDEVAERIHGELSQLSD